MCVLGYLLATQAWIHVRQNSYFKGSLDTSLDCLNSIRLTTLIEKTSKRGRPKANYQLEENSSQEQDLLQALDLLSAHLKRFPGG